MSNKRFAVPANKDQQVVIDQMGEQGYSLLKANAEFDPSLGTVPIMEKDNEKIYILPNGETCSEDEWQTVNSLPAVN